MVNRPEVTGRRVGPGHRVLAEKFDGRSTLTIEEVAEILRISRASAYAAANAGELPVVRIGRRLVIPRGALEAMLDVHASA